MLIAGSAGRPSTTKNFMAVSLRGLKLFQLTLHFTATVMTNVAPA
jgi:hypothetical protein